MSVNSEIERIKNNITNTYNALEGKGATIPEQKNSNNLASTIESITTTSIPWKPHKDWWDIKRIVEEDTENYPAKVIVLMDDMTRKQSITQNDFFNAEKIVYSDGQVLTKKGDVYIQENGMKECSDGYKTFYCILYFNIPLFKIGYTDFDAQFKGLRWIYFYNIDEINCNSSFYWGNSSNVEAIESNKTLIVTGNMGMQISRANRLKKLPDIIFNKNADFSYANSIFVTECNSLPKTEYIKLFKNITKNNIQGNLNSLSAFNGEHIDFLKDFGIEPTTITGFNSIEHIDSIEELDFINVTTNMLNGGCRVRNINKISNIKTNNNWFNYTNLQTLNQLTLVRVLNALYDYSNSETTYLLTIGTKNIAKLTEEELAIATEKGWTIS